MILLPAEADLAVSEDAPTTNGQELKDELRLSSESCRASPSFPMVCGNAGYVAVRPSIFLDMHVPMEVSTSVVLSFCQHNVLRHYYRLLAVVGWRPLVDTSEHVRCQPVLQTLNVMHNVVVFVVLVLGHVLQYTACFRRDGMISYRSQAYDPGQHARRICPRKGHGEYGGSLKFLSRSQRKLWHGVGPRSRPKRPTCGSSSFAVYVLPAMMQMAAYVVALMHTRSHENEQFQSLVEKVFLQLTPTDVWNVAKKRIMRRLHAVYAAGVPLDRRVVGLAGTQHLRRRHAQAEVDCARGGSPSWSSTAASKEARKGVRYLNQRQALAVTVQTIWVTSRMVVCFYALLGTPWTHWIRFLAAWLNVLVWLSLVLIPLVQASRLSSTCRHVRELGTELTARPFVYRDVPQSELDSFLLFTTSLRMQAKLCALPITKRTVTFVFLFIGICLFICVQLDIVRFRP
ncbi:hypothetical protein MTO96_000881 [Rhipicephalus appendiculatus]